MLTNYLRYLTPTRLWNELRCRVGYVLSLAGCETFRHMPTFLSVEPANYCMLRCPQCPVGLRGEAVRTGQADAQTMQHLLINKALCEQVIRASAPHAHTVIFHFQGEPLLHPGLPEMIAFAHSQRLYTMLSTNAQTLTESLAESLCRAGLDRIIVSIDGLTQASYEHYRVGGSLQRALAGMRAISDAKKRLGRGPEIVMQCLYLSSNEDQWNEMRQRYRELGADRLEMKTAQFYDFENGHPDIPHNERYSRYSRGRDGRYSLKKPLRNRCYRLWSGCVVTAAGDVLPCCYDKEHNYRWGNLQEASLKEIIHGEKAKRFRKAVLHGRAKIDICRNCNE